jgi:hypothetical protein
VTGGVAVTGRRNGFQLSVKAGKTTQRLRLYLGASQAHGSLSATLSDGSAPPFDVMTKVSGDTQIFVCTLSFSAASDGKALVLQWRQSGDGGGTVTLESATLE